MGLLNYHTVECSIQPLYPVINSEGFRGFVVSVTLNLLIISAVHLGLYVWLRLFSATYVVVLHKLRCKAYIICLTVMSSALELFVVTCLHCVVRSAD